MNLFKYASLLSLACLIQLSAFASRDIHSTHDPYEVRFIDKSHQEIDHVFQTELRHAMPWASFEASHAGWHCQFDEDNQRPMRAFGPGIQLQGGDPLSRANAFISQELAGFDIPVAELVHRTTTDNGKHHQVFFDQYHEGMLVMYSRLMVKMTHDGQVISWSAVVHDDIEVSSSPGLSATAAMLSGASGIANEELAGVSVSPVLKYIAVPGHRSYEHHLVYEVEVMVERLGGVPSRYICHVDANTGDLIQRIDQYHAICGGHDHDGHDNCSNQEHTPPAMPVAVSAVISANTFITDPSEGTQNVTYPNLQVIAGGELFNTDESGVLTTTLDGPVSATISLQGSFAEVIRASNGSTPTDVFDLVEGDNEVSLDGFFTPEELAGYYNTTVIHDYMRTVLTDFDNMDFAMPVNVGITPAECNAFYNGSSINFYQSSADCVSLVTVADVVFHEYGHGINDNFYQQFASNFNNGGMNEGYADVWAFAVNQDPILGDGNNPGDPEDYVRRYDQNPKVYPQDLVGQVHADGEIIAGAWWDTYLLLGSDMELTTQLFSMAYTGLQATAANGNEGQAFLDVLIDVLEADDDDANILNGTPNGAAISEGFGIHGITFLATAEIDHAALEAENGDEDILIEASIDFSTQFTDYLDGVVLNYRTTDSDIWTEVAMSDLGSNNYETTIPGQDAGTIVAYYLGVQDVFGNMSAVTPIGANQEDPNLPNYILVGYELLGTYDADDEEDIAGFIPGISSDNASTGEWELAEPVGSFLNGNTVAPNTQTTEDGEFCFVTGNSFSSTDGIGVNDVDGGTTTLISDEVDLTDYDNPAFTYMRWYTNATGANPGADWWQVQVSDDGGDTWVYVEDTKNSSASWNRNAFRIADYVSLTDEFMIKFNASDSLRPGTNLEGGSLVEAALDDFKLYEVSAGSLDGIEDLVDVQSLALFPNPVSEDLMVNFELKTLADVEVRILNNLGQIVRRESLGAQQGPVVYQTSVAALAEGSYQLEIWVDDASLLRSFIVD